MEQIGDDRILRGLKRGSKLLAPVHILSAVGASDKAPCSFRTFILMIPDFLELIDLASEYSEIIINAHPDVILRRWVRAFAPSETLSSIQILDCDSNVVGYKLSNWRAQIKGIVNSATTRFGVLRYGFENERFRGRHKRVGHGKSKVPTLIKKERILDMVLKESLITVMLVFRSLCPFDTTYMALVHLVPYVATVGDLRLSPSSFPPTAGGVEAFISYARVGWLGFSSCWTDAFGNALIVRNLSVRPRLLKPAQMIKLWRQCAPGCQKFDRNKLKKLIKAKCSAFSVTGCSGELRSPGRVSGTSLKRVYNYRKKMREHRARRRTYVAGHLEKLALEADARANAAEQKLLETSVQQSITADSLARVSSALAKANTAMNKTAEERAQLLKRSKVADLKISMQAAKIRSFEAERRTSLVKTRRLRSSTRILKADPIVSQSHVLALHLKNARLSKAQTAAKQVIAQKNALLARLKQDKAELEEAQVAASLKLKQACRSKVRKLNGLLSKERGTTKRLKTSVCNKNLALANARVDLLEQDDMIFNLRCQMGTLSTDLGVKQSELTKAFEIAAELKGKLTEEELSYALDETNGGKAGRGKRNLDVGKLISLRLSGLRIVPSMHRKIFDVITGIVAPKLSKSNLLPSTASAYRYWRLLRKGCDIKAGCDQQACVSMATQSDGTTKNQQSLISQIGMMKMADGSMRKCVTINTLATKHGALGARMRYHTIDYREWCGRRFRDELLKRGMIDIARRLWPVPVCTHQFLSAHTTKLFLRTVPPHVLCLTTPPLLLRDL